MCAFDKVDAKQCRPGCMLAKSCTLVRCERCGYEFPDPAKSFFAVRLARLFGKQEVPT
jgi:hypothetical protein